MNSIRIVTTALVLLTTANSFAAAEAFPGENTFKTQSGGLQYVVNQTDKTVVVALGTWFPTPYTIVPGGSTWAYVSSDRQTITIQAVK